MRPAKPDTDYTLELEGVGKFTYGRRTIGDAIRIRARYLEIVGDHRNDPELSSIASIVATHSVLCVSAPPGWGDLEKLPADDVNSVVRMFDLAALLEEREETFRVPATGDGAAPGAQ